MDLDVIVTWATRKISKSKQRILFFYF